MSGTHGMNPLPVDSVTDVESSTRIGHLLQRMSWTVPLTMIITALAVAAGFYWLQARPLADDSANARQREAAQRVMVRVQSQLDQIERVLLTLQDWNRGGIAPIDRAAAFNGLLIPVMQQYGVISSVHLATNSGQEILLLKTPEGWKNRLTDVVTKGKQQHWISWRDAQTVYGNEWKEQDYDPRKRPWFAGAMASPENGIYWTDPYVFQTTQDPGITASVRWTDKNTGQYHIAAVDILLTDLSRFTNQLSFGERGQVALLTDDGKILGLPRNAGFDDDESLKKAVLQEPGKIGLRVLEAALKKAPGTSDNVTVAAASTGMREDWLAGFYRLAVRNQQFRIATLAPVSDFSAWSRRLALVLFGVLVSVVGLGLFMSRRVSRDISQPLEKVFLDLEASNHQIGFQIARTAAIAELAPLLQAANSFEELSHAFLGGLAQRISLGQGSVYRVDDVAERLVLCDSYARPGTSALATEIRFGEGLLGQCALERKKIQLEHPMAGYLNVESVLGKGDPATIALYPIENQEVLLGVVEFALMHRLSTEEAALIDSLMPMLALCMEILARNERTRQLLEASQKQAAELAEQQGRIQALASEQDAIFNNAPMSILHVKNEVIHRINIGLVSFLKRKEAELVSSPVSSLFTSIDDYRRFKGVIDSRMESGREIRQEWQLNGPDHQPVWTMIAIQNLHTNGSEQAIWTIEDISERKRIEQAIQANEALLRQILDESPAAVTIATEDGRQIFANMRLDDMLGVPPGSLLTRSGAELWADRSHFAAFSRAVNEHERVDDYAARLLRFDGSELPVLLNTRWIEKSGKRLLLTWIYSIADGTAAEFGRAENTAVPGGKGNTL